jgi:hypothetical protein
MEFGELSMEDDPKDQPIIGWHHQKHHWKMATHKAPWKLPTNM